MYFPIMEITHNIFSSFDFNSTLENRAVFLDIWHKGLLCKPESMGISGYLLNQMESFLKERFQGVFFNGKSSEWASIKGDVSQGSILGSVLFSTYINDLSDGMTSNIKLFADICFLKYS